MMGSVPVASANFSAKSTVVLVCVDEIEIKSCPPDARARARRGSLLLNSARGLSNVIFHAFARSKTERRSMMRVSFAFLPFIYQPRPAELAFEQPLAIACDPQPSRDVVAGSPSLATSARLAF